MPAFCSDRMGLLQNHLTEAGDLEPYNCLLAQIVTDKIGGCAHTLFDEMCINNGIIKEISEKEKLRCLFIPKKLSSRMIT